MLKKFAKAIQFAATGNANRVAALLDQLDDPVSRKTDWTPASEGGANFRTHHLVEISPLRLELKPNHQGLVLSGLIGLVGLFSLAVFFAPLTGATGQRSLVWILLPFGLLWCGVAILMCWYLYRPQVFDLQEQWYWRGKRPKSREAIEACSKSAPLDRVHAIQIITKVPHRSNNYFSHEVNLVLRDGTRVNVLDHGDLKHIRKDAQKIANLIGVPVWDASSDPLQ